MTRESIDETIKWQVSYLADLKESCPTMEAHIDENQNAILKEEKNRRQIRQGLADDVLKRGEIKSLHSEESQYVSKGVSSHALFARVVKAKAKYMSELKELSVWRDSNFNDNNHDYDSNDLHLIESFISECEMSWGSNDLTDALLRIQQDMDNKEFVPEWDWETKDLS